MTRSLSSTAVRAAAIRKACKAKGWGPKHVSVTTSNYSMGSSLHVKVRNPDVPLAEVSAIAEEHESVRRCSITGDILSGGNRYVSVEYSPEAREEAGSRVLAETEAAVDVLSVAMDDANVEVVPGVVLWKDGSDYAIYSGSPLRRGRQFWGRCPVAEIAALVWFAQRDAKLEEAQEEEAPHAPFQLLKGGE